eukprot:CFRG4740T1
MDAYVAVVVTNSAGRGRVEKRFNHDITLMDLKNKLELVTGIIASDMRIDLRSSDEKMIRILSDDELTLAECGVEANMVLHVVDTNPGATKYTDDSAEIEKFELTKKEYETRPDTVLEYKKQNQMGRFAPDHEIKVAAKRTEEDMHATSLVVGGRCEVRVDNGPARRGTVRFVGTTHFRDGIWTGVEYDEPYGKNDGSLDGKRYFSCEMKYGGFVKPKWVKSGDYPELGYSDDEEL